MTPKEEAEAIVRASLRIDAEIPLAGLHHNLVSTITSALEAKDREIEELKSRVESATRAAHTLGSQLNTAIERSPEYDHRDKNY